MDTKINLSIYDIINLGIFRLIILNLSIIEYSEISYTLNF